MCNKLKLVEL